MLAGVRFVSQAELKELERKKAEEEEQKQKARAELEDDKQRRRQERREERRRKEESGELTWLAPGVEWRFESKSKVKPADRDDDVSASSGDETQRTKKRKSKHRKQEGSPRRSYDSDNDSDQHKKRGRKHKHDEPGKDGGVETLQEGRPESDEQKPRLTREEAGLDWMSAPALEKDRDQKAEAVDEATKLPGGDTKPSSSSKELNPYWKTGGEGLPPEREKQTGGKKPFGIGDGGASWRLKALKRAQEAAAREGKDLNEVVEERWDSLGQLAASVASGRAAPANAHRFAQKDRARRGGEGGDAVKGQDKNAEPRAERNTEGRSEDGKRGMGEHARPGRTEGMEDKKRSGEERGNGRSEEPWRLEKREDRGYLRDVRSEKSQMRRPSEGASLSWRSRERARPMREADAAVMRGAAAAINKFANDGSFLEKFKKEKEQGEGDAPSADPVGRNSRQGREGVTEGGSRGEPATNPGKEEDSAKSALDEERAALREMVAALGDSSELEKEASGPAQPRRDSSNQTAGRAQPETGPPSGPSETPVPTLRSSQTAGLGANPVSGLNANQLAAKAMRLKLMGKTEEADKLLKEAQKLRSVEVVTLPLVDAQGMAAPGAFGSAPIGGASERKQKRVQRYDLDEAGRNPDVPGRGSDDARGLDGSKRPKVKPRFATEQVEEESGSGSEEEKVPTGLGGLRSAGPQRTRYFADDDEKDLKTLVSETKRGRGADYDSHLAENIARDARFKGLADADGEYEHDDGLQMTESREKKGSQKKQAERFHSKQVADAKRLQTQQDRCLFCFDNPGKPKHLIVSIGVKAYMMLAPKGSLVPGHCYIVPMAHEVASRNLDEDVWDEVRNFKKCLIRMWAAEGKEVLFLETAVNMQRQKRHCTVEAVPVPAGVVSRQAPLYFKKALDEAESEWSQHNAKKIIDTRGKGLKASVPKNFPYFYVEFGLQGGYLHVIDDEAGWKGSFGRDVIAGMLQLPEETRGRPKQQSFEQQQKAVIEFAQKWEPHDWTKMLG